jgi:hypothetical protein
MKILPFPPRLDASSVLDRLLASRAVAEIVSAAQKRYRGLKSSPPWSEIRQQEELAFHKTAFICLYQALADWLKANKVAPRKLGAETGSIGIRSPATIQSERFATELDLAFLFAALATSQEYHASLVLPENAGVGGALLALTTEPDIRSAIESGALHTLNFLPAFKKYPGDYRGSDRYYEASCHGLKKHNCYSMMRLDPKKTADLRFAPYLERAVFNVLTKGGKSNGTGFFVTRDGYALTCHHVLKANGGKPIYDENNRFTIRYLDKEYNSSAEWYPHFSDEDEDVTIVKVRVDRKGFPEFNTLPLGGEYHPGLKTCLRGFGWPETYPLGYFSDAEVSAAEKELLVNVYEKILVHPDVSGRARKRAMKLVKLSDGHFVKGMSGSPVIRKDTGHVFAVHGAWVERNNWGLCIPVKTFLKVWREYLPCWPAFEFNLI